MHGVWRGLRAGCTGLALALAIGCEEGERQQLADDVEAVSRDVGEALDDAGRAAEAGASDLMDQLDDGARELRRQVDEATDRVQEEVERHRGAARDTE
jgi:ElaB/YqjD/DUF883 family membrane-anchored ribosome-binding protein